MEGCHGGRGGVVVEREVEGCDVDGGEFDGGRVGRGEEDVVDEGGDSRTSADAASRGGDECYFLESGRHLDVFGLLRRFENRVERVITEVGG